MLIDRVLEKSTQNFVCFSWTHYLLKMISLLTRRATHDKAFFPGNRLLHLLDCLYFTIAFLERLCVCVPTFRHMCMSATLYLGKDTQR